MSGRLLSALSACAAGLVLFYGVDAVLPDAAAGLYRLFFFPVIAGGAYAALRALPEGWTPAPPRRTAVACGAGFFLGGLAALLASPLFAAPGVPPTNPFLTWGPMPLGAFLGAAWAARFDEDLSLRRAAVLTAALGLGVAAVWLSVLALAFKTAPQ